MPLNRFHEVAGAEVAPTPSIASSDGTVLLSTLTYDGFGNLTFSVAPNDRCRSIEPDADYADSPVSETIYAGAVVGRCGATLLTTSAVYDRLCQVVTNAIDLHGEATLAGYDTFCRITSIAKPDPVNVGEPSVRPTTTVAYYLPDVTHGPFSAVLTQTQDGSDPSVSQYRSTWTYTDGLGRTMVKVDQADVAAGDLAPWVASGLPTYDTKGEVERQYLPFFSSLSPSPTSFPTSPTSEYTLQAYDSFGRVTKVFGLYRVQSLQSYYHPLSVDAWDGEDLTAAGPHYGTFVTSRKDGHGRAVSTIERIHVNGGLELHDTQTTYLPTGWVSMIRRTRNQGDDVVRWMQYDTLGRLVLNAEPNTSVGFTPTVGNTAGLLAWTYAYDDNGELVGTSDARGCGSNYAYDAAGRILGTDYSPCLANHVPYSAPDWATGDGTEVFYAYDEPDALLVDLQLTNPPVGGGPDLQDGDCTIDPIAPAWARGRRLGPRVPNHDGLRRSRPHGLHGEASVAAWACRDDACVAGRATHLRPERELRRRGPPSDRDDGCASCARSERPELRHHRLLASQRRLERDERLRRPHRVDHARSGWPHRHRHVRGRGRHRDQLYVRPPQACADRADAARPARGVASVRAAKRLSAAPRERGVLLRPGRQPHVDRG